jgi:hypothetical protein
MQLCSYAVMEQRMTRLLPLDAGWSDISSWSSLWDISKKDDVGNVKSSDIILSLTKTALRMLKLLLVDKDFSKRELHREIYHLFGILLFREFEEN